MSDNDNGSKQLEYAMLRYELARDKILNAIEGLKRELELKRRLEDDPNKYPQIERVESRIKSESSIKAKCQKKSIEPTIDNIEQYCRHPHCNGISPRDLSDCRRIARDARNQPREG